MKRKKENMELLLMLLKSYGFKWCWINPATGTKGTDRVDPEMIDTLDCDEGENYLTVRYTEDAALVSTTAKVIKIEFPPPDLLDNRWIMVYVENIDHDRDPAFAFPDCGSDQPAKKISI